MTFPPSQSFYLVFLALWHWLEPQVWWQTDVKFAGISVSSWCERESTQWFATQPHACSVFKMALTKLRNARFIPNMLRVFVMVRRWILPHAFSESIEVIMIFLLKYLIWFITINPICISGLLYQSQSQQMSVPGSSQMSYWNKKAKGKVASQEGSGHTVQAPTPAFFA